MPFAKHNINIYFTGLLSASQSTFILRIVNEETRGKVSGKGKEKCTPRIPNIINEIPETDKRKCVKFCV